jgi:PP-loop superfamily ATP-utilizing enzyme
MGELIVAFSGGKDSTAMALQLADMGKSFRLLHTATGNELPNVRAHIDRVVKMTGMTLVDLDAPTLDEAIHEHKCIPNFRIRFCTPMIKIEPCAEWLSKRPDCKLAVGLRADEEGRVGGRYGGVTVSYPLREWGWGEAEVLECCRLHGVTVPERTDCALCFYQTLHEWWKLWKDHPGMYREGEDLEAEFGHTFRSPQRDTHPAALSELRKEFEAGYVPTRRKRKVMCRVCST